MRAPIIPGFHPDPTVCLVDGVYYLATSSFEYFPAVPVFRSHDLVTWEQLGNILTTREQFVRGDGADSGGVYAGTLRHHGGLFWYITSNVSDMDAGQFIVHAEDPAGPWSAPVFVPQAIGIDPDLCWEGDDCYLTWKAMDFVDGEVGVRQARIDLASGALLDDPYPVWQGSGLMAAEGPHLYAIDGVWYLLLAEGGTERGHAVTIARGPSPRGPFEAAPDNPVLSHRSLDDPVQNVGHADLVPAPGGGWAMVHLGVRPRGSTPGFHVNGRETFVAGIDWQDGWPRVDETRYAPAIRDRSFTERFDAPELHPRWVVPGGEAATFTASSGDAGLVLRGGSGLLCTRVLDEAWRAEADFRVDGRLQLRMDHRHWFGVVVEAGIAHAIARIGDIETVVAEVELGGPATVRIEARASSEPPVPVGHGGPDEIELAIVRDGEVRVLARLDGRYLSTEVAGGFTGRMLALGSTDRDVHLDRFAYTSMPGA